MTKPFDIIILRDNQLVRGKVLVDEFTISTSFGDLAIKKSKIVHIHFKRPSGTGYPPRDVIQTKDDGDYKGKILDLENIPVKLAVNNKKIIMKKKFISTLVFPFSSAKSIKGIPDYSSLE